MKLTTYECGDCGSQSHYEPADAPEYCPFCGIQALRPYGRHYYYELVTADQADALRAAVRTLRDSPFAQKQGD